MTGYAIKTCTYDPAGQFVVPLTIWINEMKTQNLLGEHVCQNDATGIHFDLPGIETKILPKSDCFATFHQFKFETHLFQTKSNL